MAKPTGEKCAQVAVNSLAKGFMYAQHDCQDYMEWVIKQAGGSVKNYRGSNEMARACHKADCMWTLSEAKRLGKLVKGAFVFIHKDAGEPSSYAGDGYGNYDHVGMYVGENALKDKDKNGKERVCNVMHSSSTMGRVAGSTLANGFTHVGWIPDIDYGTIDTETKIETDEPVKEEMTGMYQAKVITQSSPLNVRNNPDGKQKLGSVAKGSVVNVYETMGDWCRISQGSLEGWCSAKYLKPIAGSTVVEPAEELAKIEYVTKEAFDALVERVKKLEAEYDYGE